MVEREISVDFAFDCYFTSGEGLNHIQGHKRGYVENLKSNRKVRFKGEGLKAAAWISGVAPDNRVDIGDRNSGISPRPWVSPRRSPLRLLILWNRGEDTKPVKCLMTNRVYWEISPILNVYRKPRTSTKTFHRDGPATSRHGGWSVTHPQGPDPASVYGDVEARSPHGPNGQGRTRGWAQGVLMTTGQTCRAPSR